MIRSGTAPSFIPPRRTIDWHVALILLAALALRLVIWWVLPYRNLISDEPEYLAAATWLAQGRNFSFFRDWIWTRPPLYVLFLAAHLRFVGPETLWPIRLSQALISTLGVWLAMRLGAALAPAGRERHVALTSGWLMALAYGLATYTFLLLSETLFITLLLAAFLALAWWAQRGQFRWLIIGGALLGLGALTRAVLAGVLPLIALWVCWTGIRGSGIRGQGSGIRRSDSSPRLPQRETGVRGQGSGKSEPQLSPRLPQRERGGAQRRGEGLPRAVLATALLTAVVSSVILPWSVYNTRFYGTSGLILIDTTGGYNALLGAQAARQELAPAPECAPTATRCEKRIYNLLSAIPDHAERQQVAYATAAEWIVANPAGFMRKNGRELLDLLWVNYSGAERFARGYTVGDVPAPHLLGLLLDDTLYVLAAPLALLGLLRRQGRAGKGLLVVWLLYNLVTGPLFFAINRFRLPLLPFLFIYAACGLWQLRAAWPSPARRAVGIALAGALLLVLLPSYVYFPRAWDPNRRAVMQDTRLGLLGLRDARGCAAIERLITQGDLAAAQQLHDAENRRRPNRNCLALLQSEIWSLQGRPADALALLQTMAPIPERYLLEGDVYRRDGNIERARGAFVAQRLEPQNPTTWAWDHLRPPPTTAIDLGSGLDWGYIDGFYQRVGRAEDPGNYRWTGPRARLRFSLADQRTSYMLRLRVNGDRPPSDRPAALSVGWAGGATQQLAIRPGWQELTVELGPPPTDQVGAERGVVVLAANVFVPGPDVLQDRQQAREKLPLFGVQLDWAELEPAQPAAVGAGAAGGRP